MFRQTRKARNPRSSRERRAGAARIDTVREAAFAVAGIGTVLAVVWISAQGDLTLDDELSFEEQSYGELAPALVIAVMGGVLAAVVLDFAVLGPLVPLAALLLRLPVTAAVSSGPRRLVAVVPRPDAPLLRARMVALTLVAPAFAAGLTATGLRLMGATTDDLRLAVSAIPVVAGMLLLAVHAAPFRWDATLWTEGWELCRWLFRPGPARATLAVARELADIRIERRRRHRSGGVTDPEVEEAEFSARTAAIAWDEATPRDEAVHLAVFLASHEAETRIFAIDRPAVCCRADGAVPLDPDERLAAAEELALRAATLGPGDAFAAAGLGIVRIARGRPDDAIALLRPHVDIGEPGWRAEMRAVLALARVDADPAAALRMVHSAWDILDEPSRKTEEGVFVARTLVLVSDAAEKPEAAPSG